MNNHYQNNIDDEKTIAKKISLPYCDECEKYREFTNIICSHHRSHRNLVTCNYCQIDFKTFKNREVGCSSCCRLIEPNLKTYTFEKLQKLAKIYNIKEEEFVL